MDIKTEAVLTCPKCNTPEKVEVPTDACQHFYDILPRPYGRGFPLFSEDDISGSIHPRAHRPWFSRNCYKCTSCGEVIKPKEGNFVYFVPTQIPNVRLSK